MAEPPADTAALLARARKALAELREMSPKDQARMAETGVTETDLVALISRLESQPGPGTRP